MLTYCAHFCCFNATGQLRRFIYDTSRHGDVRELIWLCQSSTRNMRVYSLWFIKVPTQIPVIVCKFFSNSFLFRERVKCIQKQQRKKWPVNLLWRSLQSCDVYSCVWTVENKSGHFKSFLRIIVEDRMSKVQQGLGHCSFACICWAASVKRQLIKTWSVSKVVTRAMHKW